MPVFQYRAKNRIGKDMTGTCEASEQKDVLRMLREKGYYAVSVKEYKKKNYILQLSRVFKRVTYKDLAVFCRQFSTMLNAGVPILACLDILRNQTENGKLREVLGILYGEVQKGKSLSYVMGIHKEVFPELLASMVETGEISGTLGGIMGRMAAHYEKEYKISQKVRNAAAYPSLIAVVAVFVVIFLVTVVLPAFALMFQQMGAILPVSTRALIRISRFIGDFWLMMIIGMAAPVLGIGLFANTEGGRAVCDAILLGIPFIGKINKKAATARFARTLGTLVASGISLLQGIEVTKKVVGNTLIRRGLDGVVEDIKRGKGLAEPLKSIEAFPPMLMHMVKIGEDTGTLDITLEKAADFFDGEVESAAERFTNMLEPAIIIVMAVVVAFIVISMVLPMFELMTQTNF